MINRRKRRWRMTGRFYAMMTVLVVAVVLIGVLINARVGAPQPAPTPVPTAAPTPVPTEPPPVETPLPAVGDAIEAAVPPQGDAAMLERLGARTDLPKEWTNILLLGSDTRDMDKLSGGLCDVIMVASVNGATGQLKLLSILRDTMIEVPGEGFVKINSVATFGGIELMIRLINENLGLNITNYAMVNFAGMASIIDILDGVIVDQITKEEAAEINKHMGEIAKYTMSQEEYLAHKPEWTLTYGTNQRLNGIQAVTYARIRYIDTDNRRTQRQRNVLNGIMARVKDANLVQMGQIAAEVFKNLKTNIHTYNALGYAKAILSGPLDASQIDQWSVPTPDISVEERRNGTDAIYDVDYPQLRELVHYFIYG